MESIHVAIPVRRRGDPACAAVVAPPAMDDAAAAALADRLRLLAEPTRLGILALLAAQGEPLCVCDVTPRFACGQPTVSHHLKALCGAGLVGTARRGVWSYFWATDMGRRTLSHARGLVAMDETAARDDGSLDAAALTRAVQTRYAAIARASLEGGAPCACGGGETCCEDGPSPLALDLYPAADTAGLPPALAACSLGCGNPTALATLRPGEVVLDLGSGAGLDVLLSARRVAPGGFAIGVDMTDEMLALALRNRAEAGVPNALFLRGRLEDLPLPAESVDVVVSNCVINLVPDKAQALREAYRVLRPGGRLAIADVVLEGPAATARPPSLEGWVGCVAGALERGAYGEMLRAIGFEAVGIEIAGPYGVGVDDEVPGHGSAATGGRTASALVRARKPLAAPVAGL